VPTEEKPHVPQPDLKLEIAHLLLIDIVGYSNLLVNEQIESVQELARIVRSTECFRNAEESGKLIRVPTGDGMALLFFRSPEEPVRCALEISEKLKENSNLQLRMGIHSGPVNQVRDVNDQVNVAGAGLNVAQRIMDCGDAGHILLSKHVADDLAQYRHWRPYLQELGEYEVKHGLRLSIVNLYREGLGNRSLPEKLQRSKRRRQSASAIVKPVRTRWSNLRTALIFFAIALAAGLSIYFGVGWLGRSSSASIAPEKSIAVLPFENLSEEKANAYFAEGVQNEILTRLAAVRDLKVISRTSTAKYQSKPDNLKTVAQELGVSTILEGAVQKAGDKVRVNAQLIDARTDTHLWAKSYDRDLKDVLGVESELSREIAEALQASLSPSESHALASVGTPDAEAYDLFLKGEYESRQAGNRPAAETYDHADALYRQALARDPNFADAAAALARSRLLRHGFLSPFPPAELEEVKPLIDRAVALAPNSPEAHLALGLFFYFAHRQYDMALAQFNRTLELQPNSALAQQYCAWVYRRRGEWERSLAYSQRAQELDPRDPLIPASIAATYVALRQWKDAERAQLRALAVDPQNAWAPVSLLATRFSATGDVSAARRALDGLPEPVKSLSRTTGEGGGLVGLIGIWAYLDVGERRFTDAFQSLETEVVDDDAGHLRHLAGRAALGVLTGQTEAAKSAGKEALPLLEATLRDRPDDAFAMTRLSWVYLALGRNADALRLARDAAASTPIEKDAVSGPGLQIGLAQIEARAGAPEEAIKRLRHLLSIPAGQVVSIALLKVDPIWDPIRNRADFQQLLSGPEQIGPNTGK
jgi:TolB-like protein/class 3 adenylate cyclase/Tfp pilus assembly protein PilF